ncbi:hypothetical protein NLG97_g3525 [Lecanicillium saksenae]|uniref:Uncharacterized protein n=1 Tax=Lecanicillium saksenae TaxID=468837 RepID=A0ACC1QZR5_9HYPO|nr:hypothetical protein NLG97_g3525 [Lecanicillium saksenae]
MLRAFLKQLHFVDDKIALFDIPALEIDTEVDGLLVLRGITISLSTLSFTVHGVEVGIKLSDDVELGIQTELVLVSLFRGIEVGDCFANIKSRKQQGNFGLSRSKLKEKELGESSTTASMPSMATGTGHGQPQSSETKSKMTAGNPPQDSSHRAAYRAITKQPLQTDAAVERYRRTLELLDASNGISQARAHVQRRQASDDTIDDGDENALRAAICAQLHSKPCVPNPPQRSVKVSALRELSSPRMKRFMHRLPMLLRLLLGPVSYFHPVKVRSVTATASGDYIRSLLAQTIFKSYDSCEVELEQLRENISSWLIDAYFTVGLGSMAGQAHVPFLTSSSILCQMAFNGVVAHRALVKGMRVYEVLKLRGADASFVVPTFLLPHHEHIIPKRVSVNEVPSKIKTTAVADGTGETINDQASVKMAVRANLPATLDQDLLNFIAEVVKHSKLVEMERSSSPVQGSERGFGNITDAVNQKVKDGVKKAVMGGDQWLAKLAGKVVKKLEVVDGDVGYSGDILVDLTSYRSTSWLEVEGEKLLP